MMRSALARSIGKQARHLLSRCSELDERHAQALT